MKSFVPLIAKAIRDRGETIAVRLVYQGEDGVRKRRYISPYGFTSSKDDAFMGLDLTDGNLKQFKVDRCSEVVEVPAHEVLIPMPMEILEGNTT